MKANLAYSAIPLTLYRNKVLSDLSPYVSYVSVLKPSQCNRKWGMVKIQLYYIINPPPTSQVWMGELEFCWICDCWQNKAMIGLGYDKSIRSWALSAWFYLTSTPEWDDSSEKQADCNLAALFSFPSVLTIQFVRRHVARLKSQSFSLI